MLSAYPRNFSTRNSTSFKACKRLMFMSITPQLLLTRDIVKRLHGENDIGYLFDDQTHEVAVELSISRIFQNNTIMKISKK
uniref:SFRICE_028554 n=1 Tax=Spodoptera frugiperda TaxID=7108 RepID=A0A2H1V778_SPOFR